MHPAFIAFMREQMLQREYRQIEGMPDGWFEVVLKSIIVNFQENALACVRVIPMQEILKP